MATKQKINVAPLKPRQVRKAEARARGVGFLPVFGELHSSGVNRLGRRSFESRHGGIGWRKKAWRQGMRWAGRPRSHWAIDHETLR